MSMPGQLWSRLVRWLLPANIYPADDHARRFRAEEMSAISVFQIAALVGIVLLEALWGTPVLASILFLFILPHIGIVAMIRRGADATLTGNTLMLVVFGGVSVVNFGSGGHAIGANIALPTMALTAMLMLPLRSALFWVAFAVVEILIVARLRTLDIDFPLRPDPQWANSAIDRVPLVLSLGTALVGLLFQRTLLRFRNSLENALAEKARALQAAERSKQRFRDFAEIAADGYWETDAELRLTYMSPSFAEAMGEQAERLLGMRPDDAYRLRFPDAPNLDKYVAPMLTHEAFRDQRLATIDSAGRRRWLLNQARPIRDAQGNFLGYRGVVQDITEREQLTRKLRVLADNDPLTGLLNRRSMQDVLERAMRSPPGAGHQHWLCYMDLDHFKSINDRHGHGAGDEVLCRFARLLRECAREADQLARMGGDEFCALLIDLDPSTVEAITRRLLMRVANTAIAWNGETLHVSASVGVAALRPGEDIEALYHRVDAACYDSKRQGRNRVTMAAA